MTKIVLVTKNSANANRPQSYEYLVSDVGGVRKDLSKAIIFDDEAHVKALRLGHAFIMFEYDGENLKRLGCVM